MIPLARARGPGSSSPPSPLVVPPVGWCCRWVGFAWVVVPPLSMAAPGPPLAAARRLCERCEHTSGAGGGAPGAAD